MNKNPIKVITFDLDDTLWEVQPVLMRAENLVYQWLQQHAPKVSEKFTIKSFMQWRWDIYKQNAELTHQMTQLRLVAVAAAMREVGYDAEQSQHLSEQAFAVFIKARHDITFFDQAIPLLEQLHQHYTLGALSNGNADIFQLEAAPYFDFSFSAEQLNASKPDPAQFNAAAQQAKVEMHEIIHIGDNLEHDIEGAQQAGCHSIWFNPKNLTAPNHIQPSQQVTSLAEIPAAIQAIAHAAAIK
ncbi:HAD family hydrolase [Oceanicoccus sp. KOV_DT_Chl]|uniref:HAD family hydrolase n=1 Tax=Oceanicoccus sp. KOV_DT_Chl TaxID=1904639 RepID=UPI000C7A6279|nr:HAD-IA family hydrolase [Oceanicoccus sp. KOV_DT_Chl]